MTGSALRPCGFSGYYGVCLADVWKHPQLAARKRWRDVDSPAGPIAALLPPGASDSFDYRMDPIPAVGAHTQAVLTELGYGQPEIDALRAAGAV